ncbi:MAG TPA: HEAT repeat domain-containing protein [Tepidisphaeraceae bacterium]|nr:HEAT repeat domain-containing protein [Tepidisphaeraceae bacterium]
MFGSNRQFTLIGGGVILVLIVVVFLTRSSVPFHSDPEIAKIEKLERAGDAKGLAEAVKSHPREDVANRAMTALAHVAKQDALTELQALLSDPRVSVRATAAGQYGSLAPRGQVGPLVAAFKDEKDPRVKAAIANALGQNQGWDGVAPLIPALDDPNSQVRTAAANAVLRITGLRPDLGKSPADRKRAIASLNARMVSMKTGYDAYWNSDRSKEKK